MPQLYKSKGFTLIELLIVIVILGILSGIIILVLDPTTQRRRSEESVMIANLTKVCFAANSCMSTHSNYGKCDSFSDIGVVTPTQPSTAVYYTTPAHPLNGYAAAIEFGKNNAWCMYRCEYTDPVFAKVEKFNAFFSVGCYF